MTDRIYGSYENTYVVANIIFYLCYADISSDISRNIKTRDIKKNAWLIIFSNHHCVIITKLCIDWNYITSRIINNYCLVGLFCISYEDTLKYLFNYKIKFLKEIKKNTKFSLNGCLAKCIDSSKVLSQFAILTLDKGFQRVRIRPFDQATSSPLPSPLRCSISCPFVSHARF